MRKILIVEDDQLIAELERDYLEASEYEVEIAKDGYEGLRLSKENTYDLILLDVMLPGVSGFDICLGILERQKCSDHYGNGKEDRCGKSAVWVLEQMIISSSRSVPRSWWPEFRPISAFMNGFWERQELESCRPRRIVLIWGR